RHVIATTCNASCLRRTIHQEPMLSISPTKRLCARLRKTKLSGRCIDEQLPPWDGAHPARGIEDLELPLAPPCMTEVDHGTRRIQKMLFAKSNEPQLSLRIRCALQRAHETCARSHVVQRRVEPKADHQQRACKRARVRQESASGAQQDADCERQGR